MCRVGHSEVSAPVEMILVLLALACAHIRAQPVLLDVTDRLSSNESAGADAGVGAGAGARARDARFASLYAPLLGQYRHLVRAQAQQQAPGRGGERGVPPLRVQLN